jgi:hypothetical protein
MALALVDPVALKAGDNAWANAPERKKRRASPAPQRQVRW